MLQTNKCVCAQFYPFSREFLIKDQDPLTRHVSFAVPVSGDFFRTDVSISLITPPRLQ